MRLTSRSSAGSDLFLEATPSKVARSELFSPYQSLSEADLYSALQGLVDLQLILRSLNSARSAFAAFTFHCDFFDSYSVKGSSAVKGSVLMKAKTSPFQTLLACIQDKSDLDFMLWKIHEKCPLILM